VRWVVVINAAGVLAGTAYTGYAISPSHAPLWAGIATFLYLIGLFVPLAAEYGSLDKGFREVGGSFVETRRRYMTLLPGDVIATGTPPGVGLGMKPPVFLKPGDVMRLGVEGLGEQRQDVLAYDPALL
jgi:hypothetical protein